MPKIYLDNHKLSAFYAILNNWTDGEKEPHLINVIAEMRGWGPFEKGEGAEIYYGDEVYILERKK